LDWQSILQQAGWGIFAIALGLLVIEFTLIHLVAKAARMKNRSYRAFYWLSFVFRSGIMWLIVASFPFNPYDPRSPFVDKRFGEPIEERYVNEWSLRPLLEKREKTALAWGAGIIVVGLIAIVAAFSSHNDASSSASSNSDSSYSASGSDSSTASTISGCDLDLTPKQDAAGYYYAQDGNCLAWRWSTKSEDNSLTCDQYASCVHAYVVALSACDTPMLDVKFTDNSGSVIDSHTEVGTSLASGDRSIIEVGTDKPGLWTVDIKQAYCTGHD
jgi:hypothetical protein